MTAEAQPPKHHCCRCHRRATPGNSYVYMSPEGPKFSTYCRRCTSIINRRPKYRAYRRKSAKKCRPARRQAVRAYNDAWYRANREARSVQRKLQKELGRPVPIGLVREHLARGGN